jgi:hypothetical protein
VLAQEIQARSGREAARRFAVVGPRVASLRFFLKFRSHPRRISGGAATTGPSTGSKAFVPGRQDRILVSGAPA